ncbi:hypothetical protein BMS3Bbin04_01552 [bacterium BMS3Bbin04]|nr:hypothetical protein BMS3Bbin04_01552 [bacterium BMS3Bbin04]
MPGTIRTASPPKSDPENPRFPHSFPPVLHWSRRFLQPGSQPVSGYVPAPAQDAPSPAERQYRAFRSTPVDVRLNPQHAAPVLRVDVPSSTVREWRDCDLDLPAVYPDSASTPRGLHASARRRGSPSPPASSPSPPPFPASKPPPAIPAISRISPITPGSSSSVRWLAAASVRGIQQLFASAEGSVPDHQGSVGGHESHPMTSAPGWNVAG